MPIGLPAVAGRAFRLTAGRPLSDFVEMLWQYDGPDPPHARERCLPTGTVEIVVSLRDDARAYDRQNASRPRGFCGELA